VVESPANQTVTASTQSENRERMITGRGRCMRDIDHKIEGEEGKGALDQRHLTLERKFYIERQDHDGYPSGGTVP
jgi:hypothetical protein